MPWQNGGRIGAQIRARREAQGRSLRSLAADVGISNAYLSRIERGERTPSLPTVVKIASALEVPPVDLAGTADHGRCFWCQQRVRR